MKVIKGLKIVFSHAIDGSFDRVVGKRNIAETLDMLFSKYIPEIYS